jgi:hypothetical protein
MMTLLITWKYWIRSSGYTAVDYFKVMGTLSSREENLSSSQKCRPCSLKKTKHNYGLLLLGPWLKW